MDTIFVGEVECCFTALFESNQFSNCYIHVYEKEARSRLFKMQDLPLTYMFEYHRFEFQPNWFLNWYQFTFNCIIISGSEVPGGAEHVLVHSETHALQWLQLQVMTLDLSSDRPISCCQNVLLHHGSAVAIVWTNHGFYSHCWSKDPFYGPLITLLFSATRTCFICNS